MTFSSQFYDTNRLDIWMSYEENMNESSIWWGTVYALKNNSAIARENDNSHKPGKHSEVPAVAWWQIGNEVTFRFLFQRIFLAPSGAQGAAIFVLSSSSRVLNLSFGTDLNA